MRLNDVPEWFAARMAMLAEKFPNQRLREMQVRAYYDELRDLPEEQIDGAFERARECAGPGSFFPSAFELRKLVEPSPQEKALMFWGRLKDAAGEVGGYQTLHCEDGAVAVAVEKVFGSWAEFCEQCPEIPTTLWQGREKHFIAEYINARRSMVGQKALCGLLPSAQGCVGLLTASGEVKTVADQALLSGSVQKQLTGGKDV